MVVFLACTGPYSFRELCVKQKILQFYKNVENEICCEVKKESYCIFPTSGAILENCSLEYKEWEDHNDGNTSKKNDLILNHKDGTFYVQMSIDDEFSDTLKYKQEIQALPIFSTADSAPGGSPRAEIEFM